MTGDKLGAALEGMERGRISQKEGASCAKALRWKATGTFENLKNWVARIGGGRDQIRVREVLFMIGPFISKECGRVLRRKIIYSDLDCEKIALAAAW